MYQLVEMDSHLREFLSQWFSVGTLRLRQVTWESPCDILEKVSWGGEERGGEERGGEERGGEERGGERGEEREEMGLMNG